jgi:hypothetical protein
VNVNEIRRQHARRKNVLFIDGKAVVHVTSTQAAEASALQERLGKNYTAEIGIIEGRLCVPKTISEFIR